MRQAILALCLGVVAPTVLVADTTRPVARPAVYDLAQAPGLVPIKDLRPQARPSEGAEASERRDVVDAQGSFADWIRDFRPRALSRGISEAVFDRAFQGVQYDPQVVRRDRNQSEFTKTIWVYLETAVSDARIRNGRSALDKHHALLEQIEAKYGVRKEIVVAIWGLESAYGTFKGSKPVIGSMATLAYDGRRRGFFEGQLFAALKILQQGHTTPGQLRGSWAGAMGHTQFMPTSFQSLAVDWTGDGKRDIWGESPADALASTAHYLKYNGWLTNVPWGVEVQVPDGFDYMQANREIERLPSAWARRGVKAMNGKPIPDAGVASLLLPAGHQGAAFLVFRNFEVIERYNTADAYVVAVGHLADRIAGGAAIQGDWPVQDRALSYDERIELQERLTELGFDTRGVDAKIGPLTVNAVRLFQRAQGLVPDGYASPGLLDQVRAAG